MSTVEQKLTNEQYHQHSAVGRSMLGDFRKSRRKYHGLYVTRTIAKAAPTDNMILGTHLHTSVLEQGRWLTDVAISQKFDRRTKQGKADAAEFDAANAGKIIVDRETYTLVEAMTNAIMEHQLARTIIEGEDVQFEHPIFWTDPETGIECKSLRDCAQFELLADVKTTDDASPSAFAKACANFGYANQCAWYIDGHAITTGSMPDFLFIVVSKEPPHPVGIYQLLPEDIEFAREQNRASLRSLAECQRTGDWRDEWEKDVKTLAMPPFWRSAEQYTFQ